MLLPLIRCACLDEDRDIVDMANIDIDEEEEGGRLLSDLAVDSTADAKVCPLPFALRLRRHGSRAASVCAHQYMR